MRATEPRFARVLMGSAVLALGLASGARADVCAQPYSKITDAAPAAYVDLRGFDGGAGICDSCMMAAAKAWNDACTTDQIPEISVDSGSGIGADVAFVSGTNPGTIPNCSSDKCGCTNLTVTNGRITGADVTLFQSAVGTADCESSWNSILTHEVGHVLGLQDASACSNRIMGNVFASINSNDCDGADANFKSGSELNITDPNHPCSNPPA